MAYSFLSKTVRDRAGNVIPAASFAVYLTGTTDLASIYEDAAGIVTLSNPTSSDDDGLVQFYANPAIFDFVITKGNFTTTIPNFQLEQNVTLERLAAMTAGDGASLVGLEDAGGYYLGTDAEAALQEIGAALAALGTTLGLQAQADLFVWGAGPFTLSQTPSGVYLFAFLDGVRIPASGFTQVGTTFTPTGIDPPYGTDLEIVYAY